MSRPPTSTNTPTHSNALTDIGAMVAEPGSASHPRIVRRHHRDPHVNGSRGLISYRRQPSRDLPPSLEEHLEGAPSRPPRDPTGTELDSSSAPGSGPQMVLPPCSPPLRPRSSLTAPSEASSMHAPRGSDHKIWAPTPVALFTSQYVHSTQLRRAFSPC